MIQECQTIIVENPKAPLIDIEKSLVTTYKKDIFRPFVKAINEYNLVEPGDKIAVGISGGKDSLILAKLFQELKKHNKIPFEVVFLSMDPGFRDINRELLENNCKYLNIPLEIRHSEIFKVVGKIAKENPCYMCARMRRGFLYNAAKELGCNKLALGHHFDDVIETTLMNMFYTGTFKTMLPKAKSKNFEGLELIRPMYLIKEQDVERFIKYHEIDFVSKGCEFQDRNEDSKRKEMKNLIAELRQIYENIDINIFRSAENINLDSVLGYFDDKKRTNFLDEY